MAAFLWLCAFLPFIAEPPPSDVATSTPVASTAEPVPPHTNPVPPETQLFARGTRAVSILPSYGGEKAGANEGIGTVSLSYSTYLADNFAIHADLVGYRLFDRSDSDAIGIDLGTRYHFMTYRSASLFAGVAGGLFEGNGRFPDEGTHFNWTYQADLGATFEVWRGFHFVGGARFKHVSNGFIKDRKSVV